MAASETVELNQLPIQHLETLRSQLEEARSKIARRFYEPLKVAQQKFGDSKENVKKLINKESGKPILVPLTSSVSF
ncbi:Prefoldin subunit 5 [Desmophyllum pertusum]|uniref:Prefoldin subunit 5 n=1 Tax=Desmophyllum pertusum TaxID=174260 RepID=A0A9X0D930_9CNID|nr:Prefoldin subunit 5 [Desmophyllum pertusum]